MRALKSRVQGAPRALERDRCPQCGRELEIPSVTADARDARGSSIYRSPQTGRAYCDHECYVLFTES